MAPATPRPLLAALDGADPRPAPTASREEKKNYAERLSNQLAQVIADALRPTFPNVTPTATGQGREARVGVAKGQKRLDVKVTDTTLGLLLSVSIKTYSFQDYSPTSGKLGRWTKNIIRNDHELRGEAMVVHQRQPYAVLVGVIFEPNATCDDGDPTKTSDVHKSSFAHHVTTLSKRTGRGRRPIYGGVEKTWVDLGAEDPRNDLFERMFIGLYEPEGADRGAVRFFDVESSPPRNGRPSEAATLSFGEFVEQVLSEVHRRNSIAPTWADGEEDDEEG
jgi:hypothetical protein